MTRLEFLKNLGLSGATLFTVLATCTLESCSSKGNDPTPSPTGTTTGNNTGGSGKIDFTLDLTAAANANLTKNGGALISGSIIIARTSAGDFVALSKVCTHEGTTIGFQASKDNFLCPNHGSTFNADGSVALGPAASPLKKYNTSLTNSILRVFE